MKKLLFVMIIGSLFGWMPQLAYADTVDGNGYVLDQSISAPSYELQGNGYTATQTVVPVVAGALEGNGFSSVPTSNSDATPPAPTPGVPTSVPGTGSAGSSSGQLAYNVPLLNDIVSMDVPANAVADSELSNQLDKLIEPFLGNSRSLSGLYQDLGNAIRNSSGGSQGAGRVPAVINTVGQVFDSKSTFSVLTMAVVVLLFMSLGVSVFGYKEIHKIISTVVCFGSLFGYYTASSIYLLPAIVGFIVLIVFMIQQKEREIAPIKLE